MDEVQGSSLSEEIDRLHAEHRRYAQRWKSCFKSHTLLKTISSKKWPEEAQASRQGLDLRA